MTAKHKRQDADAANPRTLARVAAVQALYQMDLAGTDVEQVIEEFVRLRFERGSAGVEAETENGGGLYGADPAFFADVVRGVVRRQRDIDPLVDQQLAEGWRLIRIDAIVRAILRSGVFELMERPDVPARVVINEYINVAHSFFEDEEPKVVNGVLDKLAHRLRAPEFDGHDERKAR
jgi:transcription antitermination protein NusB